eukprot:92324-Chlamydomonas_euryale.AAC.5
MHGPAAPPRNALMPPGGLRADQCACRIRIEALNPNACTHRRAAPWAAWSLRKYADSPGFYALLPGRPAAPRAVWSLRRYADAPKGILCSQDPPPCAAPLPQHGAQPRAPAAPVADVSLLRRV